MTIFLSKYMLYSRHFSKQLTTVGNGVLNKRLFIQQSRTIDNVSYILFNI